MLRRLSPVGRAIDLLQLVGGMLPIGPQQLEGWPLQQRGWDLLCKLPGTINGIRWVAGYTPITCDLSTVHTASNATINHPTIPADATTVFFGQFNPSGTRINHREKWTKFPADPVPQPIPWQPSASPPMYQPGVTFPYPAIDPMSDPIGEPMPVPQPIPYPLIPHRKKSRNRSATEQPSQSNGTPRVEPEPNPVNPPPGRPPVDETVLTPPTEPGVPWGMQRPPRRWHQRVKPRSRDRERKYSMSGGGKKLLDGLVGPLSEAGDLLGAFFGALPKDVQDQYKWEGGTPLDRLAFVFENLDKVSIPKLVGNIIEEGLEDYAFGKFGKAIAAGNRKAYDEFGLDMGYHQPKNYLKPGIPW